MKLFKSIISILSKLSSNFLITLFTLSLFSSISYAQDYKQVCYAEKDYDLDIVEYGDFTYEMWQSKKDSDGCMVVKTNSDLYASWSKIGNTLIRKSLRDGKAKKNQKVDFFIDNQFSGNAYHSCYGWWKNNSASPASHKIVEYYVVEGYGVNKPDDQLTYITNYTVSGEGTYELWIGDRYDPTVYAADGQKQSFTQIKAIRTSERNNGGITMAQHFNKWAEHGFVVDDLFEVSYKIEGYSNDAPPGSNLNDFDYDVTAGGAYISASFSTSGSFNGGSSSNNNTSSGSDKTHRLKAARNGGRYVTSDDINGSRVKEHGSEDWSSQNWTFEHISGNEYRIRDNYGNRYLTADKNYNWSYVTVVDLNTSWGSQKWYLEKVSGQSYYRIKNKWTGRYLTNTKKHDWADLRLTNDNTTWNSQRWYLQAPNSAKTLSDTTVEALSVEEEVIVYPNPATDVVNVEAPMLSDSSATITIYNMQGVQGVQVQKTSALESVSTIDVSGLSKGNYVMIINKEGKTITKMLTIN